MRPRFTLQKLLLLVLALVIFGGLAYWLSIGAPIRGLGNAVPSTAGKIAFVSDRSGNPDLWMMDGKDGGNAVALTTDAHQDTAPAWPANGQRIAFISNRRQGYLQVFLMDARPGAPPRPLTITSSSKSSPVFGGDGRVYYLAAGQLTATAPGTSDADAVFPTADLRLRLSTFLSTGGLSWSQPSPGSDRVASVLRLESGTALLLSVPENEFLFALGTGGSIYPDWLADNSLAAAVQGGGVGDEPVVLLNAAALQNPGFALQALPSPPEVESSVLAHFDKDGKLLSRVALPFPPSGLSVSPDGKQAAITADDEKAPGLFVLPIGGGDARRVFDQPATSPVWSPDGATIAFVSGPDIWSVGATGGAPVNLTKGQGNNSAPAWSPARAASAR